MINHVVFYQNPPVKLLILCKLIEIKYYHIAVQANSMLWVSGLSGLGGHACPYVPQVPTLKYLIKLCFQSDIEIIAVIRNHAKIKFALYSKTGYETRTLDV